MEVRFPNLSRRSLGVGLDLPWDGRTGFGASPSGDELAPPLRAFLEKEARHWSHAFFSWQPRDRSLPALEDYAQAWDSLVAALPPTLPRALHHTALNLASLAPYERGELLSFTRELCERYRLDWVNEDVGFWSLDGRAVPYPLPPLLTEGGLAATIDNTLECQAALPVPLLLEFPGFSAGASVVLGDMHAYDFFHRLAEATAAPVTLDVGHLLSWQWWRGRRGAQLFDELERLPLEHCFELHLSGCEVVEDAFVDAHHGALLEEQYELTAMLLERCPNLRAVTWEDPRFDEQGVLTESNQRSWSRLQHLVTSWLDTAPANRPDEARAEPSRQPTRDPSLAHLEVALGDYLYGVTPRLEAAGLRAQEETASVEAVQRMVNERRYRGVGGLREWYPLTLESWRRTHPSDAGLQELVRRFCASASGSVWREHAWGREGRSLEDALFRFFCAENVGDPAIREDEFLTAMMRVLAVAPRSAFQLPELVKRTATGFIALSAASNLHAVVNEQVIRGAVTPLIARLLRGEDVTELAVAEIALVKEHLVQRGLLSAS